MVKSYTSGTLSETRHAYFTDDWRVVEERVGTATTADRQFVGGARYIDELILRDRDTDANGTLDERLYPLQDANWNVTALADATGAVQERYQYSAYGTPTVLTPAFGSRSSSSYAWETLYAGYRFDQGTGLYSVRNRTYHPTLGMWVGRDPIGYMAGDANLYGYVTASPIDSVDPSGLIEPISATLAGAIIIYGTSHWWGAADIHAQNLTDGMRIRGMEAELESRLQSREDLNLAAYDNLRQGVRDRNMHPIPDTYNEVLQDSMTFAAGTMGPGNIPGRGISVRGFTGGGTGNASSRSIRNSAGGSNNITPRMPCPDITSTSSQGSVIFGDLDQFGRATGVRARITRQMLGTGSSAAQRIRPPGFRGQVAGHARGHLLGNQLGGSGTDTRNLITMFQNPANHPAMSSFEGQVAAAVRGGQTVDYWAIPIYDGSSPIPVGITLRAEGSGGFSLSVSIVNRGK